VAPLPERGFSVEGGFVRDPDGRALVLRGMNLSGEHKHAPYFDFQTLPDYQRLRMPWGMNAVRFLITWAAVEPQKGQYDDAYLDALATRMDWAREAGLFVVLDMHQDVYGEGFASGGGDGAPRWTCDEAAYASFVPNPSQWFLNYLTKEVTGCYDHFWQTDDLRAHYAEAWRRVAHRLSGYDDVVLGFDPMNEPYWGSYGINAFEGDVLSPFYEEVTAAVRKERPRWIAFLEPASSRNLGLPTGLLPPTFGDVVYAPHSYDRDAESGKGFDPSHRAAVLDNAAKLASEAQALNAALWIGEYGAQSGKPGTAEYMTAEYDGFAAAAAGSTYWSYGKGTGYGVLDADGSERPDVLGAIVRPFPERIAGTPASYAFDPATSTFTLTYAPDAKISAPTEISIPDRVYPAGYQVECDGCATERAPGKLLVRKPPSGSPAVVKVHP
jgi:endoglycosylceramidase